MYLTNPASGPTGRQQDVIFLMPSQLWGSHEYKMRLYKSKVKFRFLLMPVICFVWRELETFFFFFCFLGREEIRQTEIQAAVAACRGVFWPTHAVKHTHSHSHTHTHTQYHTHTLNKHIDALLHMCHFQKTFIFIRLKFCINYTSFLFTVIKLYTTEYALQNVYSIRKLIFY